MSSRRIITLTTDFGLEDEYVGVMKGVILSRAPGVAVVDLCHQIPPQDIRKAALVLLAAYPSFPPGTIHVAVVDPGVGSGRRILLARAHCQYFLAPGGGLLAPSVSNAPDLAIRELANPAWRLDQVSTTFHGRDIFAPAAAALASGEPFEAAGPVCDPSALSPAPWPEPALDHAAATIRGEVIASDRFGNLITNIDQARLQALATPLEKLAVQLSGRVISAVSPTFSAVAPGEILAYLGSKELLEIAVNQGSAARLLGAAASTPVTVKSGP